jgi:hypothetical protein
MTPYIVRLAWPNNNTTKPSYDSNSVPRSNIVASLSVTIVPIGLLIDLIYLDVHLS